MEDYFAAKRRLFDEPGPAVVNVDDEYGRRLADELRASITYRDRRRGRLPRARRRLRPRRLALHCETPDGLELRDRRCPGCSTSLNALAALAAARALGVDLTRRSRRRWPRPAGCPGRFEPVDEGQGFAVLVDYAHTPDSLENVLRAARELTEGRVHVVFGAGGDRDRAKRPLMGDAPRALADRVIVTSDNPRSEDPEAIIDEILAGAGPEAERESTAARRSRRAIATAEAGDVVVIAGKGHEQGQEFEDGRKEPFDDVTVAREALRARLER